MHFYPPPSNIRASEYTFKRFFFFVSCETMIYGVVLLRCTASPSNTDVSDVSPALKPSHSLGTKTHPIVNILRLVDGPPRNKLIITETRDDNIHCETRSNAPPHFRTGPVLYQNKKNLLPLPSLLTSKYASIVY